MEKYLEKKTTKTIKYLKMSWKLDCKNKGI